LYRRATTAVFQSEARDLPGRVAGNKLEYRKFLLSSIEQVTLLCLKTAAINKCPSRHHCAAFAVFQSEAMDLPGRAVGNKSE
jgi:hypothetical protein